MNKKKQKGPGGPGFAPMMPGGLRSALAEAQRLWRRDEPEDAIAVLVQACVDFPERIEPFEMLGDMADAAGDVPAAVMGAEGRARLAPNDPEAKLACAMAYESAGLNFTAWSILDALATENPDLLPEDQRELLDAQREELETEAKSTLGVDDAQRAVSLACLDESIQLQVLRGDAFSALQDAEKLAAELPEHAPVYLRLADLRFALNDIDGAVVAADRAFELDPTRADIVGTRVEILADLDRLDEAKAAAEPLKTLTLSEAVEGRFVATVLWAIDEFETIVGLPERVPPPGEDADDELNLAWSDLHHYAASAAERLGRPEDEIEALRAKATQDPSPFVDQFVESDLDEEA